MKRRLLSLIAAAAMSQFAAQAQFSDATDIDDLALIYSGSQNRPDWTKDIFKPYVMHTYPDGTVSWKFDGFLMLDYMKYNANGQIIGFGEIQYGEPSKRSDWEELLETQLGSETGFGCRALDQLVGELIPQLGKPGHKHKVVLNIPIPNNNSQIWGKTDDGTSINLGNWSHKVLAMKWYVDHAVKRWNECAFENIELDGFYLTQEGYWEDAWTSVLAETNRHVHDKGYKAYWIPYYGARNNELWKEYGVDVCYMQPGYYFKLETPIERLPEAINYAWENEMGLEMEFEGINYFYNTNTGERWTEMADNGGLYDYHPEFYQRLVDYIDYFENEFIFDSLPIAYYSGRQAVYDFCTSSNPKDQEVMNRLALLINKRHILSKWDTAPRTAGISDAIVSDPAMAYAVAGGIYLSDEAGENAEIYTTDGSLIFSRKTSSGNRLNYGVTVSCRPGIYIVRCGAKTIKICVSRLH